MIHNISEFFFNYVEIFPYVHIFIYNYTFTFNKSFRLQQESNAYLSFSFISILLSNYTTKFQNINFLTNKA